MASKWIFLIFFSIVTVVAWIGISVVSGLLNREVEEDYNQYLEYMSPQIDDEVINDIKYREEDTLFIQRGGLD